MWSLVYSYDCDCIRVWRLSVNVKPYNRCAKLLQLPVLNCNTCLYAEVNLVTVDDLRLKRTKEVQEGEAQMCVT